MSYRFLTKLSAGLLALLMLALTGCGSAEVETTADTTAAVETVPAETGETRPALGVPDTDFGGATFRVSTFNEKENDDIYAPESTGEAVNDAIFDRGATLTEAYNFTFQVATTVNDLDYNGHTKEISNMIMAGEDNYEMVYGHVVGTCNNALNGDYLNLYTVPNLNFDAPWWPAQSVDEMTIYDCMYTICSGATINQLASAKMVFFNKELLAQYQKELPYEWVKNGEWTIDKLIGETESVYNDTNGDGQKDMHDVFGYTTISMQNGFFVSCDTPILAATSDGGKEISVMTERTVSLVEKLYGWYYESQGAFMASNDSKKEHWVSNVFGGGNALYAWGKLQHASEYYRDADISYGILPQPKFDEKQTDYMAFACPSLFSIPITCQNTEFAGLVFEALTYYGYYDVIPVYYETTLQGKIADAPEDVEMLEIINDALTVSFAYCYDNWEGFAHFLSGNLMNFSETGGNKDVASLYQKNLPKAQARLDKCLAAFKGE